MSFDWLALLAILALCVLWFVVRMSEETERLDRVAVEIDAASRRLDLSNSGRRSSESNALSVVSSQSRADRRPDYEPQHDESHDHADNPPNHNHGEIISFCAACGARRPDHLAYCRYGE